MHEYNCTILKVIDGDTVDIDIDLGFHVSLRKERVRILGIDTPESRTSDKVEKLFGLAAKHRVQELLKVGSKQHLISKEFKGKFGRILGDFKFEDGSTLTGILLNEHQCAPYFGKSKKDIKNIHLANRTLLVESGIVQQSDILKAQAYMKKKLIKNSKS